MGIVSEHRVGLVAMQGEKHSLVVSHDAGVGDRECAPFANSTVTHSKPCDFDDRLRRAANPHLEPDLNDSVVLNIAPLWELVPWKVAKEYWDELLAGNYEWSTIGNQLREREMVK